MMRFNSTYLKLTGFYVLIIMAISIGFSVAIYRISAIEIGRGLGRQSRMLQELSQTNNPFFQDFERIREQQIEDSNNEIRTKLYYFNLLILLLSTVGSYYFARSTLKPIEESYESQQRFTADASHELRTPLTAMKTEIEVALRDEKLEIGEAKELLNSNLEEIDKLEQLSKALLKLAKTDAAIKDDFRDLSLKEVLAESIEKVAPLAEKKAIVLASDLAELQAKGDKQSLGELFVILLENAIKYSPAKSKINIALQKIENHNVIRIKDRGIGIKASDLPHIFERFYRADHSRNKEKVDGYGLGLSIAKQIAEMHGGKISVTSTAGRGSEFVVKL